MSACWRMASPLARISADCVAKILAIARAFPSSLLRAFRSPPDSGVGWYFGAIRISRRRKAIGQAWSIVGDGSIGSPSDHIRSFQLSHRSLVNGGFPWLEIRCSRCKTPSDVDLAAMKHPPTTFVHDLASRLRCRKCAKAGRRPPATLLQLAWQPRHPRTET
jgi:hypothetical protein